MKSSGGGEIADRDENKKDNGKPLKKRQSTGNKLVLKYTARWNDSREDMAVMVIIYNNVCFLTCEVKHLNAKWAAVD